MLVPSNFEKCILCNQRPPDPKSREHPIPESIGGTLEAVILCKECNSWCGSEFVSQLKKDPSVRKAVEHLQNRIPEFASQFFEGVKFHAEGAGGIAIDVSRKGDEWKTKAANTEAHGIIMDTQDVPKYIRNTLEKRGLSEAEVESWVDRFAACEDGDQFALPNGDALIKNKATIQSPKLTEGLVDDRLAALIAFEFLALCIGNSILVAEFDAIRAYICSGRETEQIEVLNKRAPEYAPEHRVRFQIKNGILTVFIQFFRWYVFEVRFHGCPMPPKEIVYIEDLENKQKLIALSPEDAAQGKWTVL